MRALLFLFVASSVAQTSISGSATGSVAWEASGTWGGGVVPTGNGAVTIAADVQVTVSTAYSFVQSAALTLGALGTPGTQLILNSTGLFSAAIFDWYNGYLVLQGNSNFEAFFGAFLYGGSGAQDRRLSGGVFTTATLGVTISGGNLLITGTQLHSQGFAWSIGANSVITFAAGATSWLISDVTFNGGGNLTIQGELQCNASNVNFGGTITSNPVTVWVASGGNFTLTGSGQATVNAGASLVVAAGARLKRWQATTTAALNVAASATVEFAAGTTSWLDANIVNSGNVVIDAGATTTVSANSAITGSGSFNINGNLAIAAGVSATFAAATFANASAWNLAFAGSSFAAVTVSGALQLGGQLFVDVPVQPSTTVVLVTAASISGSWSGAATITTGGSSGRRLLTTGTINQNSTTITYTPGSSANKAGFFFLLPVITGLALW